MSAPRLVEGIHTPLHLSLLKTIEPAISLAFHQALAQSTEHFNHRFPLLISYSRSARLHRRVRLFRVQSEDSGREYLYSYSVHRQPTEGEELREKRTLSFAHSYRMILSQSPTGRPIVPSAFTLVQFKTSTHERMLLAI